ncbi:MAG: DNA polymerase III subunit alpha [Alphaproteobacteria bacterium]|nr:DNA polymerase III subunit alpha [Alphaproteobacteria bacterium]
MPDEKNQDQFIHLHVHSAYSLAEGAIKVKDLVKTCQNNNIPAIAVTDTNNMYGAMEFASETAKSGVQAILGVQVVVGASEEQLVLLVQSEQGYRNICRLLSDAYMDEDSGQGFKINFENLKTFSDGLICLSGGVAGAVGQRLLHGQDEEAKKYLLSLKEMFGDRLYIELQRHNLAEEDRIEDALIELAYSENIPLVATNNAYFGNRAMHEAHDALLCIADGRYVTEDERRRETKEHYFKSAEEMCQLFSDLPEAIANTTQIAKRCHYLLKKVDPILPPFETEGKRTEYEELKDQTKAGLQWRLEHFVFTEDTDEAEKKELTKTYFDRMDYELGIIESMGFPGYFLIVSDFIKWSKEQNIPVGPGRGSGAGSVVAWSLKITDLDPLKLNLLFERFLNPERISMPDFDIDFCQDRRDEVIRYVQDKYGHDRVAQIITFGKLQARAVVRDVGRVLQVPYPVVDRIAKMIPNNPANPLTLEEALEQDQELRNVRHSDETHDKLITIALQLEGLYRHASTHAAGLVIGDRALHELLPLYRDPRSDMPVTQYNMKYVEDTGLVKFDFLGLKTMTVVQKSVELIKDKGIDLDILYTDLDDKKTYDLLSRGHSTGVFQLESSGMKDVLKKLKPNRFEDIIALVALYRPGPMDNIPTYIAIKDGKEEADYMHPLLKPVIEETFGIMIYQEQVMQAAQVLGGYTLGGADILRRAMGKKIVEEMDNQRQIFTSGANKLHDVPEEQADKIFDQIAKFAGYGFNKSHAAAYALIAYWTAWLKANHPVEFMAASMTLDLGNTEKLAIFKHELDQMNVKILPPDINKSQVVFSVEGDAIRYALAALKGVGENAMACLIDERNKNGEFKSLDDFITRVDSKTLNKRQVERLVAAGAFESLVPSRSQVYASVEMMLGHAARLAEERETGQNSLFGGDSSDIDALPPLPTVPTWDPLEKLSYEFEAVGFYLSAHPLDTKLQQFKRLRIKTYMDIVNILQGKSSTREKVAGVLIKKQIKVSAKSGNKYAFLQISDTSGIYEAMAFSETISKASQLLEVGRSLLFTIDAEYKDDQLRLLVQDILPMEENLDQKISEVRLVLTETKDAGKVAEILKGQVDGGRSRIFMSFDIDSDFGPKHIEMKLPHFYDFTQDVRRALYKVESVKAINEL